MTGKQSKADEPKTLKDPTHQSQDCCDGESEEAKMILNNVGKEQKPYSIENCKNYDETGMICLMCQPGYVTHYGKKCWDERLDKASFKGEPLEYLSDLWQSQDPDSDRYIPPE